MNKKHGRILRRLLVLMLALILFFSFFSCNILNDILNSGENVTPDTGKTSDTEDEGGESGDEENNAGNLPEDGGYDVNENAEKKSIKILIFGNSYGNDASYYLPKMLECGGYNDITIGHVGESSMAINDHYHNIDDDPANDYIYNGHTFSVHYKTVNGKSVSLPADYKAILSDEPWDYVLFYQGPNSSATLTEREYYSECDGFIRALRENMTNKDGKIIYYMTWAHNVTDTLSLYNGIVDITRELISEHCEIDGVLPAATLIQNLRTSYLKDGKGGDITRDWGHLNYGVGRYAMALLWYVYLTDGTIDDITFMPTFESEMSSSPEMKEVFTDVNENNIKVIKEAVLCALDDPYSVTQSSYKTKP